MGDGARSMVGPWRWNRAWRPPRRLKCSVSVGCVRLLLCTVHKKLYPASYSAESNDAKAERCIIMVCKNSGAK